MVRRPAIPTSSSKSASSSSVSESFAANLWAADLQTLGPPPVLLPVELREIESNSAGLVAAAMDSEGELVPLRLQRGCRCFAAFAESAVVGYGWLSTDPEWIGELALQITPAGGEAYLWNCVTLVPHRRRGVFRTLLALVTRRLAGEGLRRLWIGSVEPSADQAVIDAGFLPVLRFEVSAGLETNRIVVRDHPVAAPGAVEAARRALGIGGQSVVERSAVKRKH